MKTRNSSAPRSGTGSRKRKPFYVDLDMCGGEAFLEDFDLEGFCAILQRLVPGVQVIPAPQRVDHPRNVIPSLVSEAKFNEAIIQYCQGCLITGCSLP